MKIQNKIKRLLIWVLILALMSSTVVFAADTSSASGSADGATMGTFDGNIAGHSDVNVKRVNNYLSALPTTAELITRYSLNFDNAVYQNAFIIAFNDAFQTAYNSAYRLVNIDMIIKPNESAFDHGAQVGAVQGEISAMIDFTQGGLNNWLRAYNEYIQKGSLTARYLLDRESLIYRNSFTSGYREAFMNSYIMTFQTKNLEAQIRNKNAKLVSMNEEFITFDEEYVSFAMGSAAAQMRTPLSLDIPAATLYKPTYFSVFSTQNSFGVGNRILTPVSNKYTVAIWNDSGLVTLRKPITLSFEYFGSERAGVYQWVNNEWVYQYTNLTDGSVFITIPAGYYSGGEYAIFIDETYKTVSDIPFNWAFKEIYTLMRRDVISDAQAFLPNSKITKAQLALMVYNTVAKTNPLTTAVPTIADASSLGSYKKAVEYMVGKRYMKLDANGKFNPGNSFTYLETEAMLSNMMMRDFRWIEITYKMLMEKFARSEGTTTKTAYLTKAEAAYMLYVIYK